MPEVDRIRYFPQKSECAEFECRGDDPGEWNDSDQSRDKRGDEREMERRAEPGFVEIPQDPVVPQDIPKENGEREPDGIPEERRVAIFSRAPDQRRPRQDPDHEVPAEREGIVPGKPFRHDAWDHRKRNPGICQVSENQESEDGGKVRGNPGFLHAGQDVHGSEGHGGSDDVERDIPERPVDFHGKKRRGMGPRKEKYPGQQPNDPFPREVFHNERQQKTREERDPVGRSQLCQTFPESLFRRRSGFAPENGRPIPD